MSLPNIIFILFVIFLAYFLAISFIYLALLTLAFTGSVKRLLEARFTDFNLLNSSYLTIPVSIVIPAYNEEMSIMDSIYSAINLTYPESEIIIVNDGSTDRTLKILIDEFELEPEDIFYPMEILTKKIRRTYRSQKYQNMWIIDKDNGGKADAVNAGVNLAKYRYIAIIDADSIFDERGVLRISRLINSDPAKLVAIGGQLRIANGLEVEKGRVVGKRLPRHLVAKFQIVEYLGSFLGNRVGWSELNSVLVISGGYGLWRKDIFVELGGMTTETTHEDIEFTFRLHEEMRRRKQPYQISFLPDPIVWTEVPDTWRSLFVQRRRWQRVVNEVAWRYRRMFFNPRYGTVGMLGMPYLVFFETLGPFIEIASYLTIAFAFIFGLLTLKLFLLFLLVSFGLTSITRIASVFVEQYSFRTYPLKNLPILFLLAIGENFGYHQYITVARLLSYIDFFRGKKTWEKIPRRGFSSEYTGRKSQ